MNIWVIKLFFFLLEGHSYYKSQDGGYLWEKGVCEWDGVPGSLLEWLPEFYIFIWMVLTLK